MVQIQEGVQLGSPVVEAMRKRLSSWSGRHLSMRGRVILINSILTSIPLYFLSFYKTPKKIAHEIFSIQRNFFWSGSNDVRKTCWIGWDKICLSKKGSGLGVKNIELFNISLLSKWKWRCLSDENVS